MKTGQRDIDMADLKSSLREAQKKPMFFAFVAKGTEGKLLVEKTKIPPKETAEATKACGGGTIFQGRCFFENDTMIFEIPVEPPGTLAAAIKKVIKTDASMAMNVVVRFNAALVEGAEGEAGSAETPPPSVAASATPPPTAKPSVATPPSSSSPPPSQPTVATQATPPPPPDPRAALVIKRLNGMSAGIKKAVAGPNKARVQTLFVTVNASIKSKDFEKATKTLDELEPLVIQSSEVPVPPVTPKPSVTPPPPKAPPKPDPLQAEWERRVSAMEPRVLGAKKTRPNEANWMTLFTSVQNLGFDGDYSKALEILDQLQGLLDAKSPTPQAAPPNEFEELYNGLKETIPADLQRLRGVDSAKADQIQKSVDGAATTAQNGDFQSAFNLLQQATGDIATALSEARAREAKETIPEGKVAEVKAAFEQARVRWDAALQGAKVGIKPIQDDLKEEDPLAVTGLNNVVNSYWQDLITTLQAGQALQNQGDVEKAISDTLQQVRALKAEVAGDDLLTYLDSCGLKVKTVFDEAFDDVVKLVQS